MTDRNTIQNELMGLGSTLANNSPQNFYAVPDSYFEGLANQILNRVKALDSINVCDEIAALSVFLHQVSRNNIYSVPDGYFEGLEDKLMQCVREHADYQNSNEELMSISPLLGSINKKSPYSIPAGYFEDLNIHTTERKEVKVISITPRRWNRLAAAAVMIGVIAIGGLLFINKKQIDPVKNPDSWVAKNTKKISNDEVTTVINLDNNEHMVDNGSIASNEANMKEIKELVKDIPEKEIDNFLNETDKIETTDEATLLN